ncbi:multicomponent Na+:H+ antiporter subunit D [Mesorhizobium sp. J18]|uniref:Na+/H+ antiporter subunit D n=1 Tax=Mesorhizobium sp. J18 TaxID=935263 RepID=UPI001199AB22|nr:Na+/H+ antiporter subunit D [Mesorhizobium sp. J18]TWG99284.1 multicomponent Na+:H+ antiporter subunit D [Mesorhizobium sp. J18]
MAAVSETAVDISSAMITAPTPLADWVVIAPVAVPILFGAFLLMVRHHTRVHAVITLCALGLTFVANVLLLGRVLADGPVVMTMGRWLPPFGISFTADTLGASMALVGTLVAIVCALYSTRDIEAVGRRYGFYPFMLLMMAGVGGAFLTGDIFNLYVWFEVFLISSFGMLVLGSEERQLDGAMKYGVLNLIATTLFLIATAYLYGIFGTLNMADIAGKAGELRGTAPLTTLAMLYLLAFGMKAAAFPVNFWLPASYHTPRIVTAALFGSVLTKIGVYALLRTLVMLFPPERAMLSGLIAWVAAATMILGVMGALAQTDIRRMMGFVVISGIGVMMAGLALGTVEAVAGTVLYAFHSMLLMAALYLLAGIVNEAVGSYSLREVSGLYRSHPLLAGGAFVLVLPASGLWPKVLLVKASLDAGNGWLAFAILASGILTTIALGRFFILAFWRQGPDAALQGEVPVVGYVVLAALTLPVIAIGVYPEPFIRIAESAAAGLIDPSVYIGTVFPAGATP